jgi:acetyl-CoA C-acetyltransferase
MHRIQADDSIDGIIVAGGVESMSNQPYVSFDARWGARLNDKVFSDAIMTGLHAGFDVIMGLTAENLVEKYGFTREAQDEVALRSHNNAEAATNEGRFKEEIVPVLVPQRKGEPKPFEKDEHFRPGLTMDQLARLPPVFKKGGTVTAGNSSGINDGAAACVIMSEKTADDMNFKPLARILGYGLAGVDPYFMGEGPIPATRKALAATKMSLDEIDLIEINEAFASVYLTGERGIGFPREIANVNGSGIGLGHPVGCTGARIIVTLLHELRRRQKTYGLATLCGGGGLGMTTIIEAL